MQSVVLRGREDIESYAFAVCDWLKSAELGGDYCGLQPLLASFRCLASAASVPESPELVLHPRAGWPLYRTFVELIGQHAVAAAECQRLEDSIGRSAVRSSAVALLRRKLAHYRGLRGFAGLFKEGLGVAVLKGEPEGQRTRLRVRVDRIDQSGCLERLTVELCLSGRHLPAGVMHSKGQGAQALSEALKDLIYRLARRPLEHCLAHLQTIEGLMVTRVAKGRLGPFSWREQSLVAGDPWAELFAQRRGPTLLCSWHSLEVGESRAVTGSKASQIVVAEADVAKVRALLLQTSGLSALQLRGVPNY